MIIEQTEYKTGSQWPGEFSHFGTRSENVLSAQSSNRPAKQEGQCQRPRFGGLLASWTFTCRDMTVVSLSPKPEMRFLVGGRWVEERKKPHLLL